VTHFSFMYVELVDHCIAVEPVVHYEVPDVEFPRSQTQKASLQPFRELACGTSTAVSATVVTGFARE
jgi:hypothetical protein